MFRAGLFSTAKTQKQPECLSINDKSREMWCVHTHTHTHTRARLPAGLAPWVQGGGVGAGGKSKAGRKGKCTEKHQWRFRKQTATNRKPPDRGGPQCVCSSPRSFSCSLPLWASASRRWTHRWTRLRARLAGKVLWAPPGRNHGVLLSWCLLFIPLALFFLFCLTELAKTSSSTLMKIPLWRQHQVCSGLFGMWRMTL